MQVNNVYVFFLNHHKMSMVYCYKCEMTSKFKAILTTKI